MVRIVDKPQYLHRIVTGGIASGGVPRDKLDAYLRSHLTGPEHVWVDDFDQFFAARESALLDAIRTVMGKQIASNAIDEPDEAPAQYELVQEDSRISEDVTL